MWSILLGASEPGIAGFDLDPEAIGNVLIRLALVSHQLNHERVTGSLRPYCNHPENLSAEAQFVYDMFIRRTPEIIDRWFGGDLNASVMIARTVTTALTPDPA